MALVLSSSVRSGRPPSYRRRTPWLVSMPPNYPLDKVCGLRRLQYLSISPLCQRSRVCPLPQPFENCSSLLLAIRECTSLEVSPWSEREVVGEGSGVVRTCDPSTYVALPEQLDPLAHLLVRRAYPHLLRLFFSQGSRVSQLPLTRTLRTTRSSP